MKSKEEIEAWLETQYLNDLSLNAMWKDGRKYNQVGLADVIQKALEHFSGEEPIFPKDSFIKEGQQPKED